MKAERPLSMSVLATVMILAGGFVSSPYTARAEAPDPRPGASTPVQVQNTTANPVPVQGVVQVVNPQIPYQEAFFVAAQNGQSGVDTNLTPVPAGMRLVIEYVSIRARTGAGQEVFLVLGTRASGTGANHSIPVLQTFTSAINSFNVIGGQTLRLYADAETTPFVSVGRSSTAGGMDGIVTVSGYYIPQ